MIVIKDGSCIAHDPSEDSKEICYYLQSVLLVVTSTCAAILRVAGVEVVSQRETYCLRIGINVLSRLFVSVNNDIY